MLLFRQPCVQFSLQATRPLKDYPCAGRGVLEREGGGFTIWKGDLLNRGFTISMKIFKFIWKYFHLVLKSYGKTLVTSWHKYINVCFHENYSVYSWHCNNTRNIHIGAHHWPGKRPKRRVPQQPMKQILHKATHFVRVEHQKSSSWELNKKMVFLFLLSWTLTEGSTDKKISNFKT